MNDYHSLDYIRATGMYVVEPPLWVARRLRRAGFKKCTLVGNFGELFSLCKRSSIYPLRLHVRIFDVVDYRAGSFVQAHIEYDPSVAPLKHVFTPPITVTQELLLKYVYG